MCVAHRGQIVWHQAYGAAALLPHRRAMQRETLFDVASLTKVVATTSLVLLAHHDGVCRLDDAIARFYPQTAATAFGNVTLRHLLTHSSGLTAVYPLYRELFPHGPHCSAAVPARALRQQAVEVILRQPLAYTPGSRALYSDLGFILLADILERQYQQPLDRLFQSRVAHPLGLHQTHYRPLTGPLPCPITACAATEQCRWRRRVVVGEVHDENAWSMGGVAGHAGLFTTAGDLWYFAHALLETAAGRHSWLPATLLRESWQRQETPQGTTRAIGWDTPTPGRSSAGQYFSARSIGHLGFTGCSLWIDLHHQTTVVLCTNRVHPSRYSTGITRLRPAVHNCVMRALGVAIA